MSVRTWLVAAVAMVSVPAVVATQKPVRDQIYVVDGAKPPDGLAEMSSKADAVVIVRSTGKSRLRESTPGGGLLRTIHSFEIRDVLKFHHSVRGVGDLIDIELWGGEKEYSDHVLVSRAMAHQPIRPNRLYLIFVTWIPNRAEAELVPTWSTASVFDVTDGRVTSLHAEYTRQNGRDAAQFVAGLRDAMRR